MTDYNDTGKKLFTVFMHKLSFLLELWNLRVKEECKEKKEMGMG